eukprot:TRINITY_DN4004_c0_g1_i3.p1 TRINITY_DN4004_c0_g1~~TRINITY_DN4004_c0_g1_i3.p1  ORF type:complete len:449 (+),score=124.43 TRINITY_DN4004_c0_g1_i3:99-1445(+)
MQRGTWLAGALAGGCAAVGLWQCARRGGGDNGEEDEEGIGALPSPRGAPARGVQIIEGGGAYAALNAEGRLKCWGHEDGGGVQPAETVGEDALLVQMLAGTENGFAAIMSDGRLLLWGELTAVKEEVLKSFPARPTSLVSTRRSVLVQNAAGDGVLFGVWGVVEHSKLEAFCLTSTEYADAAILAKSGEVFAVGESYYGAAPPHYTRLTRLFATGSAFAATKEDGTVVSWGDPASGGEGAPSVPVATVVATAQAFCALTDAGTVHAWGMPGKGGDAAAAQERLTDEHVVSVHATRSAFAALTRTGRVVVWGSNVFGGRQESADAALGGRVVREVFATHFAFAALCEDGSVAAWGDAEFGGSTTAVRELLREGVRSITAGPRVFGALKATAESNQIVVWGSHGHGGAMPSQPVANVASLFVGAHAVVAVGAGNALIAWGDKAKGGVIPE